MFFGTKKLRGIGGDLGAADLEQRGEPPLLLCDLGAAALLIDVLIIRSGRGWNFGSAPFFV